MNTEIKLIPSENPKVPEARARFHHNLQLQLRFNDFDMVGHLNNAVYVNLFDLGKIDYFQTVMPERIDFHDVPVVVVNVNCSFFAPTYMYEKVDCVLAVYAISERSIKMEQRIYSRETGEVKSICYTVLAGFDAATATGAPIDPVWAEALRKFEGIE